MAILNGGGHCSALSKVLLADLRRPAWEGWAQSHASMHEALLHWNTLQWELLRP